MNRSDPDAVLSLFHPLLADWFARRYAAPTEAQQLAWPVIAAGQHVLVTAPTGSGKTLTAFLWSLNQLLCGAWPLGGTRVLYVSPLKALNNDIQRNLLTPLRELRQVFEAAGEPFPDLQVLTRSGDTEPAERRRMLRRPPEILITTPESLNLLLSARSSRANLTGLATVILDEIHAVADSPRGTHLITAVDRLVPLAGEFQRLALSATVRPLSRIAEFIGGRRLIAGGEEPVYEPREVAILQTPGSKVYETAVHYPVGDRDLAEGGNFWEQVAAAVKEVVQANRSTLVFCNTRMLAERLAHLINAGEATPLAFSHHGSLSRETRSVVEARLKAGELRAIVATGSLELGIDIGALDQVVLVQTPHDVAAAIQRVGRAGHGVGEVSRAVFLPTNGRDLLEAAVMTRCIDQRDLDETVLIEAPLDVLAQVIVSMVGVEPWTLDGLFDFLRTSRPYWSLTRRQFDLVVAMLAGRYAETRLPALQPRVVVDPAAGTIVARDGALRAVYQSGGTIPDRGYFALRHVGGARIGELDEEFVWERRVGHEFVFGTQTWRIEQITHNDVLVTPTRSTGMAPFWRGEPNDRGAHFSTQVAEFLEDAERSLDRADYEARLVADHRLDEPAAIALQRFLQTQRLATGRALPHRHHLLIEQVDLDEGTPDATRFILHTLWGGKLNRPYAIALCAAIEERLVTSANAFADDECIVLTVACELSAAEVVTALGPDDLERHLRARLESSGVFGARFRECAGRALLLTRGSPDQRMPLWLTRERAKKLLEVVSRYGDFPLLVETWRTCLQDEFDLLTLRDRLAELHRGAIRWSHVHTSEPSPFAGSVIWYQTNELMYLDDTPRAGGGGLDQDLLREVVFSPHLRPALPPDVCARFQTKLHRTHPGYEPRSADELVELVRDRLLVPEDEWLALVGRLDWVPSPAGPPGEVAPGLSRVAPPGARWRSVAAVDNLPRLRELCPGDWWVEMPGPEPRDRVLPADDSDPLVEALGQWLQYYGPVPPARLAGTFGWSDETTEAVLSELVDCRRIVVDQLIAGGPPVEVCDADHLERLLRLARRQAAPSFEPLPVDHLPLFLAQHQGLTAAATGAAALPGALDHLLAWPAAAAAWETELLPARVADYRPGWLDELVRTTDLMWLGCAAEQVTWVFADQLELVREGELAALPEFLADLPPRELDFTALSLAAGSPAAAAQALWSAVWQGWFTADSAALRQGVRGGFGPPSSGPVSTPRGSRWAPSQREPDRWRRLAVPVAEADALAELEQAKERVRLLLDRYGVLFRELLERELPPFHWRGLFRALRLMELSGELVAGLFFEGVAGVQFTDAAGLERLRQPLAEDAVYWLSATDPASASGLRLEGLDGLPERRSGNTLVYHGRALQVVVRRSGRELDIRVPPDHPRLADYLACLGQWQHREVEPLGTITIETINGQEARRSAYVDVLRGRYRLSAGYKGVQIWR